MITVTLPSKKNLQEMEARFGATKELQALREVLDSLHTALEAAYNSIQRSTRPIDNSLTIEQRFDQLDSLEIDQNGNLDKTMKPIPIDLASITILTNQEEYDEYDGI